MVNPTAKGHITLEHAGITVKIVAPTISRLAIRKVIIFLLLKNIRHNMSKHNAIILNKYG